MKDMNALPDVLTAGEVATYLRISKTTVCRWCNTGKLPAFRIGRSWRVQRSDLELCIRRHMAESDLLVPPPSLSEAQDNEQPPAS